MAYTQKPGRSPLLKTGNGIPSALLQQRISRRAGDYIEDVTASNRLKLAVEGQAKSDSISASKKSTRSNKYKKAQEGNEAANKTRAKGGVEKVQRFSNPNQYSTYQPRTGEKDTYSRGSVDSKSGKFKQKQTESDPKKLKTNTRTGEADI
jgi:hypothetical protein